MSDLPPDTSPPNDPSADPNGAHFAQVTSGIYRRVEPTSVWHAIEFAIRHQLPAENPTIMMMFVRIAEVYPEVSEELRSRLPNANPAQRSALELILNPPEGIRQAEYLPSTISSPGEMDLCWSEFLVTGSIEPIQKVIEVLDREDVSRRLINSLLAGDKEPPLELNESELEELASIGIALGRKDWTPLGEPKTAGPHNDLHNGPHNDPHNGGAQKKETHRSAESPSGKPTGGTWTIMSPGDVDVLLWFGVKDQKATSLRIVAEMSEAERMHLATKGAAMWSLRANAGQHGKIRAFCEEQCQIAGGTARLLIDPSN